MFEQDTNDGRLHVYFMIFFLSLQNAEEDDEDWGEDFSEDAVRQRMEELSEAAKQMAFTDDLEKTVEERLNMFYHFVKVEYFIFLCYIWILDIFTTR